MNENLGRRLRERTAAGEGDASVLVPAATVVLLRDASHGLETLMLRRNSKIAFGGAWVFPGGRIDDGDAPGAAPEQRARVAAVREVHEETSLELSPDELLWFSHWTPPAVGIRRFNTWFFAASAPGSRVVIDAGEITESQWLRPADALAKQREGEIELVPPTFVTLHHLQRPATVAEALRVLRPPTGPRHYVSRLAESDAGMVILWDGDAGYRTGDPAAPGPRHRLLMARDGFAFDDSGLG